MRKRINNDFDALVEVLHEGVKIDLSLYEITGVRLVSNQAYPVTDYEVRNGSLFLHVTPLIVPKIGRYKIVVTYRIADPTLADGFWNFEFDKYLVTIVGSSEEEDAGDVVITADAVIGMRGQSAYQVWLDAGNTGTVEDYLADIKGDPFTYNDLTPEQKAELKGGSMNISNGAKTNADAGVFGQISITDDYMYICVMSGSAGSAIWKKTVLFQI